MATDKDTAIRISDLETDVRRLMAESKASKTVWYKDWREVMKAVALPFSFAIGMIAFYDQVILRADKEDAEAGRRAEASMRELSDLNAKTYALNATGGEAESSAIIAATQGQRERLVKIAYDYWQQKSDFFTSSETQILANELQFLNQTDKALGVANALDDSIYGALAEVNHNVFKARILYVDGPAQNITQAREHMRIATKHTLDLRELQKIPMTATIASAALNYELQAESKCEDFRGFAQVTQSIWDENPELFGGLKADTRKLLDVYDARCPAK